MENQLVAYLGDTKVKTNKIVQKIRIAYPTIKSYRKLAKIFKVSPTLVAKIIRNEIWKPNL